MLAAKAKADPAKAPPQFQELLVNDFACGKSSATRVTWLFVGKWLWQHLDTGSKLGTTKTDWIMCQETNLNLWGPGICPFSEGVNIFSQSLKNMISNNHQILGIGLGSANGFFGSSVVPNERGECGTA